MNFSRTLGLRFNLRSALSPVLTAGIFTAGLFPIAPAAQAVKLQVLYRSGKAAPGSDRPLAELSAPAISGDRVVFLGRTPTIVKPSQTVPSGQLKSILNGVYTIRSGKISLIKQVESLETTAGLQTGQERIGFAAPVLNQESVFFTTYSVFLQGGGIQGYGATIERYSNGRLQTIVPKCVLSMRSSLGVPVNRSLSLDSRSGTIGWVGNRNGCPVVGTSPPDATIWRSRQGKNEVLVDYKTPLNNTTTIPTAPSLEDLVIKDDKVLFSLGGLSRPFPWLFTVKNGQGQEIYGENTAIPNIAFSSVDTCGTDFEGDRAIFCLTGGGKGDGIYQRSGNSIKPVVTINDTVPGETRKFSGLKNPRVNGGNVFFSELIPSSGLSGGPLELITYPTRAIYVKKRTGIVKVFAVGGAIEGKEVTGISTGTTPINRNRMVFAVKFKDGSTGVVQANL